MLRDYVEIFAWSYEDMPGLDTDIVVHRLPVKEDCRPKKQKVHRMRPEMSEKIKAGVMKQFDAGFLAVTSYPKWVANVVPVPKKDGKYTTQKVIKGSVVADHLAHQAVDDYQSMSFEFPDEDIMIITKEPGQYDGPEQGSRWTMVFDGAFNALGNGVGVVIISPEGCHTPITTRLCFYCTNNMAEYEACILGIKAAIDMKIQFLDVYGDSALVVSQIKGYWDTKHENLIPYREHVLSLIPHFEEITFGHIPRGENQLADALATMASMFEISWDDEAPKITIDRFEKPAYCNEIDTEGGEEKPWFYEVKRYLETQEFPERASVKDKKFLRRFSAKFFLSNGILYKRNHDSTLLRCVDKKEAT
ncbi:uncharacterized protein LOC127131983 [Lathyrus oleraceus]|uniref:uncharacterized protein LOC127131983 n=1 Tax=Pisum sativum TaxID=3888 RepID=UPI0021D31FBD|nr:uncharacterized protein LOC127131983 [Pisum sativum]